MSEQQTEQEMEEVEEKEDVSDKKPGTDYIDLNELPEPVQKRFNRIYGNMKEYERQNRQLIQDQQKVLEKLEKLEGAQVQDKAEHRFEALNAKKEAALESGDIDRVREIDREISETVKEYTKPKEPEPEAEIQIETLPPELETKIQTWANEFTDDGDFVRPWAQLTHPLNQRAIPIAQSVLDDPEFKGADADDILSEIDKRVTASLFPKKQKRAQTVLSADGDVTPSGKDKTRLNDDQKHVAHRLYNKLSPKEAEERYAKALKAGD